jgi:hypothetical protein
MRLGQRYLRARERANRQAGGSWCGLGLGRLRVCRCVQAMQAEKGKHEHDPGQQAITKFLDLSHEGT